MAMWVESRVGNKFHLAVTFCLCSAKRRFRFLFVVVGRLQKRQTKNSSRHRKAFVSLMYVPTCIPSSLHQLLFPPSPVTLPTPPPTLHHSTDYTELHASLPAALSLGLSAAEECLAGWERAFEPLSHVHLPGDQLHGRNSIPEPASEYWERGKGGKEGERGVVSTSTWPTFVIAATCKRQAPMVIKSAFWIPYHNHNQNLEFLSLNFFNILHFSKTFVDMCAIWICNCLTMRANSWPHCLFLLLFFIVVHIHQGEAEGECSRDWPSAAQKEMMMKRKARIP